MSMGCMVVVMTEKRYYVNCAGYLCDMDLSNTISIFECADLLNEQEERIRELEEETEQMKGAFKRKFDYDIEDVVDEICDEDW